MKIMTVIGTRPEIIRLSLVIKLLDGYTQHILVHTGQNFDDRLNNIFFRELSVRQPDISLGITSIGFADQVGQIIARCEPLFLEHRPDRLLILGDTNSGLCSFVARRLGIPVYHLEAGNRCHDDRVPEETNRRVIDHCSSVLMPYTYRSKENLLREGIPVEKIFVTGNPIKEVMDHFVNEIAASAILRKLALMEKGYFVVTLHRAENVDIKERLGSILQALELLHSQFGFPVICSLHPRTRERAKHFGIELNRKGVMFLEPLGFFDFVSLEKSALCLLSDSGTVQEEACILGIPNVTIRDVTERPETIECGSNVLAGCDPQDILKLVGFAIENSGRWAPPAEYMVKSVAATVMRILLGFRPSDNAEMEWRSGRRF